MRTNVSSITPATFVCGLLLSAAALAGESDAQQVDQSFAFSWLSLVKPMGIATLSIVGVTFLTGLIRRRLRGRFLKIHFPLALAALILGAAHGLLVFILYR